MVRRFAQVSLAVFLVLALAGMASAGLRDVPNTTQKGSLLVFPKVANWEDVTTYFFIGNDFADNVWIKCYWMDENQTVKDFLFPVTANQPIYFSTKDNEYGPPFNDNTAGSLVCWAQDARDTAPRLSYNHLYGYAMLEYGDFNVFYNAYSFKIVNPAAAFATLPGGGGELKLDGVGYDNCHKYLVTNFIPAGAEFGPVGALDTEATSQPELTLWPCKQDLRQDRVPTCTKAKFDVWNWNERKYTGAYQCFKCFFEGYLHVIGNKNDTVFWGKRMFARGPGANGAHFTYASLGDTPVARMRVQGVKSDPVCTPKSGVTGVPSQGVWCSTTVNTGLLGVMLYGAPGDVVGSIRPEAAYTLHGAGQHEDASFIRFDTEDSTIYEAPVR